MNTIQFSANLKFYAKLILSGMTAWFMAPAISTFWVLRQLNITELSDQGDHEFSDAPSFSSTENLDLHDVLRRDDLFDSFMQHLIREFSMENLLAIIEFTQFKNHAKETFNINDDNEKVGDIIDYTFASTVPLSDIVYNGGMKGKSSKKKTGGTEIERVRMFKIKAYKLYGKYVKWGSEFEVNISHRVRVKLDELMGSYDKWIGSDSSEMEVVDIFDAASTELGSLLRDSLKRFTLFMELENEV